MSYAASSSSSIRVRDLGLTSTARHRFYSSFVAAAARSEVGEAGGAWSAGSTVEVSLTVEDARALRGLLGVMSASADSSELAAFQSAASWGLRVVGIDPERLRDVGLRLGLDRERVDAILDQGRL